MPAWPLANASLVSYTPLAALTSGVLKSPGKRQRRLPGLPREALATRSEERIPPARGPSLWVRQTKPPYREDSGACASTMVIMDASADPYLDSTFASIAIQQGFFVPATSLVSSRFMLPQAAALMRL